MFIVIVFILSGILCGYSLRKRKTEWLSQALTLLVWVLLFLMGIEVGSDEHIMQSLPTLGVEALVVAALATIGSCTGAWMLWRYVSRRGRTARYVNGKGGTAR